MPECKRVIKGKRETYAGMGMLPEENEDMLPTVKVAVKDMCGEYKVEEKVGHLIFSFVTFVRPSLGFFFV